MSVSGCGLLTVRIQREIESIESNKKNAHSHLLHLRNQIVEQTKALEFYKSQCEYWRNQLIVLHCQRKQLVSCENSCRN
jgi:hypothetical protein